jgi:hypothetical protein
VARWLATKVGPRGEVVALDYSAATIAAAVDRHDGSNVRYTTGDVSAMDAAVRQLRRCLVRAGAASTSTTRSGHRRADPRDPARRPDSASSTTDWESLAFDGVPSRLAGDRRGDMHGRLTPWQRDMGARCAAG